MIDLTTYALLRKQITTAASGISDVRAEGDELVFVLADGHEVRVAIPATEIRDAVVRDDVLVLTLTDGKEVVVDATLTQSGQAADAKVTGDTFIQLKDDLSANSAADADTRRKLDYLWKLNQGISYQFETDATEAYSKTVPSGAKMASVEEIGGKTVVWNQPWQNKNYTKEQNGISITVEGKHFTAVVNNPTGYCQAEAGKIKLIIGHKYLFILDKEILRGMEFYAPGMNGIRSGRYAINTPNESYLGNQSILIFVRDNTENGTYEYDAGVFDLTQLFGSGNEPTDISDSRIAWLEAYAAAHPEYNAGELVSADVESVIERGKNMALLQQGSLGLTTNVGGGLGNEFDSTARLRTNFIPISTGVKYKATYFDNLTIANGIAYDKNKNPIDYSYYPNVNTGIFTVDNDEIKYIRLILRHIDGIDITPDCRFQFEVGETSTQYSQYHENTYAIPASIRALPGYGWSAGSVANTIERTEKGWRYVQRVGSVDMGTLNWFNESVEAPASNVFSAYIPGMSEEGLLKNILFQSGRYTLNYTAYSKMNDKEYRGGNGANKLTICDKDYDSADAFKLSLNGENVNFELSEPIITDITSLMKEPFEVEAGGILIFENAAALPVPNSVEYIISLAEVGV